MKDEAITNTMTDLAVYALLCRILWEEARGKRIQNVLQVGVGQHFDRMEGSK